ncbi:hypothetical protein PVAP13_7NG155217 [Panicum virgatum]|uniref:Uncharacterized protein n=1 Tax=Panicum virgatum TaxID=38727 RepID=A0A8T0Q046_PANVG|nr:hypothetical protein PVAP13_7NG155217 [Panicum virgatum]KAG2565973.1 hypothetical protein PVAP13_7NG155217 [Panicum virgatum]
MDDIRKILLLSYYDLPPHLKTCLLYLSVFPEDYEIKKDRLIWRWVAEGFVQQARGDQSFLEIGESYFNELLNRCLIQPADMDDLDGTPHACRVHDIVLDLIISLSAEECFITTILAGDGMESKVRWLSLQNNNSTTWATTKMPKLRSLTIFTPDDAVIDPTREPPFHGIFCYVYWIYEAAYSRTLQAWDGLAKVVITSGRIAEELGHLTELRVLKLSTQEVDDDERTACSEALLESLGKLTKVECLDIRVRFNGVNLDGSMAEPLGNLRRLSIAIAKVMPTLIN